LYQVGVLLHTAASADHKRRHLRLANSSVAMNARGATVVAFAGV
jgi:hypothetical protein